MDSRAYDLAFPSTDVYIEIHVHLMIAHDCFVSGGLGSSNIVLQLTSRSEVSLIESVCASFTLYFPTTVHRVTMCATVVHVQHGRGTCRDRSGPGGAGISWGTAYPTKLLTAADKSRVPLYVDGMSSDCIGISSSRRYSCIISDKCFNFLYGLSAVLVFCTGMQ